MQEAIPTIWGPVMREKDKPTQYELLCRTIDKLQTALGRIAGGPPEMTADEMRAVARKVLEWFGPPE